MSFGHSALTKPSLKLEQPIVTQFQQLALTNRSNTHFQGIKSVSSIRSASTGPQGLVMLNRNVLSSQGLNSALHSTDGAERSIEGIVRELDRQSECLNQSKVEEEAASRLLGVEGILCEVHFCRLREAAILECVTAGEGVDRAPCLGITHRS